MNNPTAKDFYKPTKFNPETLNQIWMSEIQDSHDIWCDCKGPFAHLLTSIFPPDHKDRYLTVDQIIKRDFAQAWHSGGEEEENHGLAGGDTAATLIKEEKGGQEEDIPGDVEELLAAIENAEQR